MKLSVLSWSTYWSQYFNIPNWRQSLSQPMRNYLSEPSEIIIKTTLKEPFFETGPRSTPEYYLAFPLQVPDVRLDIKFPSFGQNAAYSPPPPPPLGECKIPGTYVPHSLLSTSSSYPVLCPLRGARLVPSSFKNNRVLIINCMDEWTIKTPNPICRLFFKIDLLTDFCGIVFHRFYRLEIYSLMVCFFDPACELLPPMYSIHCKPSLIYKFPQKL
jgi:hypothetical protein